MEIEANGEVVISRTTTTESGIDYNVLRSISNFKSDEVLSPKRID